MRIRQFDPGDRAAVLQLWHDAGLVRPWNDPERDLDRKLADSPWGMLVGVDGSDGVDGVERVHVAEPSTSADRVHGSEPDAEESEEVVAVVMVGYDGHRGSIFYLAVDPVRRGRGYGSALMTHAEALLLERGCPKLNVSVRAENSQVIGFYADRGYRLEGNDYAVNLGLRLIEDGPRS